MLHALVRQNGYLLHHETTTLLSSRPYSEPLPSCPEECGRFHL